MHAKEPSMLALAATFIYGDNLLCHFRRDTVMDKVHECFNIFEREAAHALLPFQDHFDNVDQFIVREPVDSLDVIFTVLGEMV